MELQLAPKGGLTGFVERSLRHALMTGQLKPGQRLVTRDLAARLGTSLTPVREALLRLSAAGALQATPAQAFQVPLMSVSRYREIGEIRRHVEGLAAVRATDALTPAALTGLRAINKQYRAARRAGEIGIALSLNQQFRFSLYGAANMPVLLSLIEGLWLQVGPSLNFLYPRPAGLDFARHAYDDLLAALRARDHDGVRAAIERAIDAGTRILLANLEDDSQSIGGGAKIVRSGRSPS